MTNKKLKSHIKIKALLSLACLLIAIAFTTNAIFAFFSDVITGNENITAGTLDLVEDTSDFYINGSATPATAVELANINPGDTVTAKITVTNTGSKSAWLQFQFNVAGTDSGNDIDSVFDVYEGVGTDGNQLTGAAGVNDVNYLSNGDTIMDGSYEIEDGSVGTSITLIYTIVFNADADNTWQGKSIALAYTVKALQYRNNATPNWADAVALQ